MHFLGLRPHRGLKGKLSDTFSVHVVSLSSYLLKGTNFLAKTSGLDLKNLFFHLLECHLLLSLLRINPRN